MCVLGCSLLLTSYIGYLPVLQPTPFQDVLLQLVVAPKFRVRWHLAQLRYDLATANACALVQTLHAEVKTCVDEPTCDVSLIARLLRAAADACLRLKDLSLATSDPYIDIGGRGALPASHLTNFPSPCPSVPVAFAVCLCWILCQLELAQLAVAA